MKTVSFVNVLSQSAKLFNTVLGGQNAGLTLTVPTRFVIVDPDKKLKQLEESIRGSIQTTPDATLFYYTDPIRDVFKIGRDGVSEDPNGEISRCIYLNNQKMTLITIISMAEESKETSELLQLYFNEIKRNLRLYEGTAGNFVKIVCYRIFTDVDVISNSCYLKAKNICKVLYANLQQQRFNPSLVMANCFWNNRENKTMQLTRLGEQIVYLQAKECFQAGGVMITDNTLPFKEDDYPWLAFKMQETHVAEIPLFTDLLDKLKQAGEATLNSFCSQIRLATVTVKQQFLRKIGLQSMTDLTQNLTHWAGYVPVRIQPAEWTQSQDIEVVMPQDTQRRRGLLGSIFGAPRQAAVPAEPIRRLVAGRTEINNSTEELSKLYYQHIISIITPYDFCMMVFRQLTSIPHSLVGSAELRETMGQLIDEVFQTDTTVPENTIWVWLRDYYRQHLALTDTVLLECYNAMVIALQNVEASFRSQLDMWVRDAAAAAEMTPTQLTLHMTDNEEELYQQLIQHMEACERDNDFLTQFRIHWEAMNLNGVLFDGVLHFELLPIAQEGEPNSVMREIRRIDIAHGNQNTAKARRIGVALVYSVNSLKVEDM